MNGVHDLGGMHGFGPVAPEPDEPVFHTDWERRVHAMVIASPTRGNIDAGRHQRELIPGPQYLRITYYERWFEALCQMLLVGGVVTKEEMMTGRADPAEPKAKPRLSAVDVVPALSNPGSYLREAVASAAFKRGDLVRARNFHPSGHTRLPRYVRGKTGVIEHCHGAHVFPDSHARGEGEAPSPLYTVRFTAQALWGVEASDRQSISLDLWEPYLEPA